jgi:hypothetical protein
MSAEPPIKFEAIELRRRQIGRTGVQAEKIDTTQLSEEALEQALAVTQAIAAKVDASLSQTKGPNEIQLALGLSVQAGGDIWIANLTTTGTITVTMTWKRE